MIAVPPISSKLCQPAYSFAPITGMVLSHARSGNVMSPLEMALISGPLPSTILLTSKAIGMINTITNNSVITRTARERRPNMIFCKRNNTGQVAITTVPAHAKPRIKGCTIHRHATIMMAKNSTESRICATSLG